MSRMVITCDLGKISLLFRPDAAAITCSHIAQLIGAGLFNNISWYRSDFVIQTGLYGTSRANPFPNLPTNETSTGLRLSNVRGTVSIAHHDVPDNGNSEFFINLQDNVHLDKAYGGYCVFANVEDNDEESFKVVDAVARAVKAGGKVLISKVDVV